MKKFLLTLLCLFGIISINAETITFSNTDFSGTSTSGYVQTETSSTVSDVTFAYNNFNPSTGQIRGNQSDVAKNFYFYNTTPINGKITSITITAQSAGLKNSYIYVATGDTQLGTQSNGTKIGSSTTAATSATYDIENGGSYFELFFQKGATSGTVKLSSIVITYESAGGGEEEITVCETPVISPAGGKVVAGTEISITCGTEDATIYYTLDGTEPSAENGTEYTAPFALNEECTVSAIAVKDGCENSEIATAEFTIKSSTEGWVKKDITEIKPTDIVVIVDEKGNYAMSNDNGTSKAPAGVVVTIVNDEITSDVADNLKWNIVSSGTSYTIYPNGNTATWLYCTASNNGVRVGTNTNKTFTFETTHLKNTATERYLGVFTSTPDWRCYISSTTANIADTKTAFYVYTTGGEETLVCATPVISPASGEVAEGTEIIITAEEGATIYYTLDGTEPSAENGTEYTGSFALTEECTVKAIAVKDGYEDSFVATATYTFPVVVENIAAFIEKASTTDVTISGTVTVVAQSGIYLFLQDETAKIVAYGTLSNTYSNGDQLTGIKGSFNNYNGLLELNVVDSSFGEATPGTPVEPATITLSQVEETELLTYVKIEGVTIPEGSGNTYTITDETGSSTLYNSSGIVVPTGEGLTVIGFRSVYGETIQIIPVEITANVVAPVITPNGGSIDEDTQITITAEEGVTIYYTIDGTEPTEESDIYTGPFTLETGTYTVQAIAVKDGSASFVATATFNVLEAGLIYYESFNQCDGTGGNDDQWSGSGIANNDIAFDNAGNIAGNGSGANECAKFGTGSKQGSFTTATLTGLGNVQGGYAIITFKAAAWNGNSEKTTINVSISGGGELRAETTTLTMVKGVWTDYTLGIAGGTADTKITISAVQATNNRFFLDEVRVTASNDTAVSVEEIGVDAGAPVEYFNMQGVKVVRPENGIFIKKQGAKATKVVL